MSSGHANANALQPFQIFALSNLAAHQLIAMKQQLLLTLKCFGLFDPSELISP